MNSDIKLAQMYIVAETLASKYNPGDFTNTDGWIQRLNTYWGGRENVWDAYAFCARVNEKKAKHLFRTLCNMFVNPARKEM